MLMRLTTKNEKREQILCKDFHLIPTYFCKFFSEIIHKTQFFYVGICCEKFATV
jgi:hypothetical protein